ncbi:hypothetical protein [Paraglaciecola hydrolytica]|uniref:Lipoprotein n=1 Tax=Paraglaciecola hydrolytica TaxID=1799789 RepID=A0A148KMD4_9ALTE|nr:hypothetical protein [Paraglaciecola hydrolytica]KXI27450.1 hypothetical protein AX660_22305 [Paraglaciecola hydrolytica]
MTKFTDLVSGLSLLLFLSSCSNAAITETPAPYTVNLGGNGKAYYHVLYDLSPKNLLSVERVTLQQFVVNGGQFELLINKAEFPIPAPQCKSDIILRMPWVAPQHDVSEKYQLYLAIVNLADTQQGRVPVAIELNPYIEKNEDGIQLQHCNVFFRHTRNHYISHIHALEQN